MKISRLLIAIQQAIMRHLWEKLTQANLKLGRNYPESKLSYTQRGASAGMAWLESYEVRLNPALLLENSEAFIGEVVPHELVHLLVWKHSGRIAPHDKEWKWMMENVLDAPACHAYRSELQSVRHSTFPHRYKCQEYQFTVRHHNRAAHGEAVYRCVHCGKQLIAKQPSELSGTPLIWLVAHQNSFRYVVDSF